MDLVLRTERLELRSPRPEDMALVFDATRYPGFNDGMLWEPPATLEECVGPLREALKNWDGGSCYVFTLALRESGEGVGRLGLRLDEVVPSVGFWTHPRHQSFGYMTEALGAALELAFGRLGVAEVEACHAEWNVASRRVLEKCGFRFRRRIEEGFRKRGEWVAEDVLSLRRREWEGVESRASSLLQIGRRGSI